MCHSSRMAEMHILCMAVGIGLEKIASLVWDDTCVVA